MNTAINLQLLDSNNNNISPAVCVDSLYFERTQDGNTYRMAMRNRILVAGDSVTLNMTAPESFSSLTDVHLPYMFFRNVDGTNTDNGRIIQVDAAMVNIGPAFQAALDHDLAPYLKIEDAKNTFLNRDGSDWAYTKLRVRENNGILLNSPTTQQSEISLRDGGLSLSSVNSLATISANGSLDIKGSNEVLIQHPTSGSQMKLNVNGITANAPTVDITGTKNVNINSNEVDIIGKKVVVENTTGNTALELNDEDIKLRASKVFLYDAEIQKPTDSQDATSRNPIKNTYLKVEMVNSDAGVVPAKYVWATTPQLDFVDTIPSAPGGGNIEALRDSETKIYAAHLWGAEEDVDICSLQKFNVIALQSNGANTNSATYKDKCARDSYFRSIRSGKVAKRTLIPYGTGTAVRSELDFIDFKTINGQSLIGSKANEDIVLLTHDDVSSLLNIEYSNKDIQTNQQYKIFGASFSQITNLNNKRSGNIEGKVDATISYVDGVYFKGNGNMYANQYYTNSDERLKTEIKEIDNNLPELKLKEFVWKDSSVKSYGFIAQEVEENYPELVETNDSGIKKVDYNAALALKVAQLENEVKFLRSVITEHILKNKN